MRTPLKQQSKSARLRAWPGSRPTGLVLMYHRIRRTQHDPWRMSVSPEHFEQHLALLSREKVVPLQRLPRTPGGIAVTFDDGYADNLETALPLLEKFGIPATIFVATDAFRGREFWWDRVEHALCAEETRHGRSQRSRREIVRSMGPKVREMHPAALESALGELGQVPGASEPACPEHRMMTPDEVRRLAASPLIEIGAHTETHACLPRLAEDEQLREMTRSRAILEELTGGPVSSFSYPYGAHDDTSVRAARRAGFELACIVGGGLVRSTTDPLKVPRLMVFDLSGPAFALHIRLWKALRWLA